MDMGLRIQRFSYLVLGFALLVGACSGEAATDSTAASTEAPETTAAVTQPAESTQTTATGGEGSSDSVIRVVNPEEPPSLDMTTQGGSVLPQILLYNTMETDRKSVV